MLTPTPVLSPETQQIFLGGVDKMKLSFKGGMYCGDVRRSRVKVGEDKYFKYWEPHGKGTYTHGGTKYVGSFRKGHEFGDGKIIFANGASFKGKFMYGYVDPKSLQLVQLVEPLKNQVKALKEQVSMHKSQVRDLLDEIASMKEDAAVVVSSLDAETGRVVSTNLEEAQAETVSCPNPDVMFSSGDVKIKIEHED